MNYNDWEYCILGIVLTSSVIGFLGGLNSTWYDLPLGVWMRRPVILRTKRPSSIENSTTEFNAVLRFSNKVSSWNWKFDWNCVKCQLQEPAFYFKWENFYKYTVVHEHQKSVMDEWRLSVSFFQQFCNYICL